MSSVAWSAIFAGAVVTVAASLALLLLGSGLGLTVLSPWSIGTLSVSTFAVSTAIWLIVVQWISSALGGYLTGRLRTRWAGVHSDEVFFRDTAHGLLTWSLATVIAAAALGSAVSSIVSGGEKTVAAMTSTASGSGVGNSGAPALPVAYFVDLMFRPSPGAPSASGSATAIGDRSATLAEASRILLTDLATGPTPQADRDYLAQLVASHTMRPLPDAQQRVNDVLKQIDQAESKTKEAADVARKAGVTTSLLMVLALVIGAFIASVSSALGGRLRDEA
jgi:hypothetical protein